MSGSVKENIKNDRKRRGKSIKKDTITPTTTEDMLELQRIYKYNLRKHGLKGA
jgi:hypothetical protein